MFVWLEEDDDVVEDYRTFEGHREDITHMAAFTDKQVRCYSKPSCIVSMHTMALDCWVMVCHKLTI